LTDYRRTEEELWEEEVVAEDDRPTHLLPLPGLQAAKLEATPGPSASGNPELDVAAEGAAIPEVRGPRQDSVGDVARFITDPVRPQPGAERQVDSPSWSLSALTMIENDVTPRRRRPAWSSGHSRPRCHPMLGPQPARTTRYPA